MPPKRSISCLEEKTNLQNIVKRQNSTNIKLIPNKPLPLSVINVDRSFTIGNSNLQNTNKLIPINNIKILQNKLISVTPQQRTEASSSNENNLCDTLASENNAGFSNLSNFIENVENQPVQFFIQNDQLFTKSQTVNEQYTLNEKNYTGDLDNINEKQDKFSHHNNKFIIDNEENEVDITEGNLNESVPEEELQLINNNKLEPETIIHHHNLQNNVNEIQAKENNLHKNCCNACRRKFNIILEKLNIILANTSNTDKISFNQNHENYNLLPQFPLNEIDALKLFDQSLVDNQEIKLQFENFMQSNGGSNFGNFTYNILTKIITNELCNKLTWIINKPRKMKVSKMNFINIIKSVVRIKYNNISIYDVEHKIHNWILRSSDRLANEANKLRREQQRQQLENEDDAAINDNN